MLNTKECQYLNDITAKLYADVINSGNGEQALRDFLEGIKELVPFEKGEIYFCKFERGSISYEDFIFYGWTKEDLERYHNDEIYQIDEVLPIVSSSNPIIFRSSDVFIQSEREKTKYYKDIVHPIGMEYSIEGNIYFEEGELSAISIHRSENNSDFTPKALEVIKFVRPHLINISKMHSNFKRNLSIVDYKKLPFDHETNDISFCVFDKNFKLIDADVMRLIISDDLSEGTIINKIRDILCEIAPGLEENPWYSSILEIANNRYSIDIEMKKDTYDIIIHDFFITVKKLLLEVREKYSLSPREYEVLLCITEGLDTSEIAEKLFISITTVKKHLVNLYRKLNIKGRHQVLSIILRTERG